jgi:polyhydroxybutyrate depolymerase
MRPMDTPLRARIRTFVTTLVGVVVLAAAGCSSTSSHASPVPSTGAAAPTLTTTTRVTAPAPTTPASCTRPHAAGQVAQSFTFLGVSRAYQLYVPATYTGTKSVPVVFDFHGFGSNAVQQMAYGNFKPEADRDDFLLVAPDGQVPANRHFNLTGEKGLQNDVQMVGALLDHIEATLCVDTARVYATGMSDGGAMTSVLACRMSNRFAAFGAVAVVVACGGTRPVPIMGFAGTADPVVPFNGGRVNCCGGGQIAGASPSMTSWAKFDKCATKFTDTELSSEVTRRTWSGCAPGSAAIFYIINGGGHTWPGSIPIASLGKTTEQIDASATIWKFFQAHPLT